MSESPVVDITDIFRIPLPFTLPIELLDPKALLTLFGYDTTEPPALDDDPDELRQEIELLRDERDDLLVIVDDYIELTDEQATELDNLQAAVRQLEWERDTALYALDRPFTD